MESGNSSLPHTHSWYSSLSFTNYKYYRNKRVLNSLLKEAWPGYNCHLCKGRHRAMPRLRVCMMRQASWKSKLCRLVNNSKCLTMLTVWNLYSYIIPFREESFLTETRYLWRGRKPGWPAPVNWKRTDTPKPRQIRFAKPSNHPLKVLIYNI